MFRFTIKEVVPKETTPPPRGACRLEMVTGDEAELKSKVACTMATVLPDAILPLPDRPSVPPVM